MIKHYRSVDSIRVSSAWAATCMHIHMYLRNVLFVTYVMHMMHVLYMCESTCVTDNYV